VKALPTAGQTMYRKTFNSAFEQYDDEGKAHATAWAQVKTQYKKVGDKWVAKEASMPKVKEKMSDKDRSNIIQAALEEHYHRDTQAYPGSPIPSLRDIYEDSVVYNLGGSLFEVTYTMDKAGKVTFGEVTKKVIAQTVYKAIESLREKYAELIQEAGERGVAMDALREVAESCDALIGADEPDEDAVNEAISGTEKAIEWMRLQEATKTEDGVSYPSSAFAYAPDPGRPSTWKLRLWEDPEKKVTKAQLGRAAAALSPGGFRGNRIEVPSSALAGVKAKIRAAYRKLEVKTEDIPKWVKDADMRERVSESCEISIDEVTKAGIAKGIVPVRIIKPGFNTSESRYYSEQAVKDAAMIFDGSKMYADHATESEEKEKPERSIRDWVATLHNTKVADSGNAVGEAHINAGWLKEKIANLFEQGDLQHLGTSINAVGKGTNQTIEGKKTVLVEGLVKSTFQSVDFVTEPGAGGQAGLRESARENFLDVDLMDLAELREARPDLVMIIETDIKESIRQEVNEKMAEIKELEDLKGQVETLTAENGELRTQIEEAEKAKAKAEAQATIKEAVDKAELPGAAKARLIERFAEATTDEGVAEAIKAEADYVMTIKGDGRVKGLGGFKVTKEVAIEELKKSFREANPTWTDEQVQIAADGR